MIPGQYIKFDLDQWEGERHFQKEFKVKILAICVDPIGIHESKCGVKVNNEEFGIPFSEVKSVSPGDGEQLKLDII